MREEQHVRCFAPGVLVNDGCKVLGDITRSEFYILCLANSVQCAKDINLCPPWKRPINESLPGPPFSHSVSGAVSGLCRASKNQKNVCEVGERSTYPAYEPTPGVVSQTPAFPGSLYRMVTPVGDLMVVTSVAFAGICLDSRLGTAFTVVEMRHSKPTTSVVSSEFVGNMLGRNNAYRNYADFE